MGLSLGLGLGCAQNDPSLPKLVPVPELDLSRYAGTWFEIAAMPNPFQRDCYATEAIYQPGDDGGVRVTNRCHKGGPEGPLAEVVGRAWRPNPEVPSALKVQFFWPFRGDYWVLALDEHYGWAVVGQPKRKYLWILAREPHMAAQVYEDLVAKLPGWGYDPSKLRRTAR